jgi:hypothetical protein
MPDRPKVIPVLLLLIVVGGFCFVGKVNRHSVRSFLVTVAMSYNILYASLLLCVLYLPCFAVPPAVLSSHFCVCGLQLSGALFTL